MKRRALAVVAVCPVALCAAMSACSTSSGSSGGSTTDFDSSAPQYDSSMPGVDSSVQPEAAPEAAPTADAGAADSTMDAPEAAAPTCSMFDAPVEFDASDLDGATSVNAEGGVLPGPPPSVCSITGDTHAPIEVINNSPCAIDVWWVGYDCEEVYYGTAAPNGGTFSNDTWETSPWRLRLSGSEELVEELPPLPEGAPDAGLRIFTYP